MNHIAIDVGGRESQICYRAADGTILKEERWKTHLIEEYLSTLSPCRVILETCAESFRIAEIASRCGHDVRVVPATLAPSLGVGARRMKTDRRDAQALSLASCRMELSSVHIPSPAARERHSLVGMRSNLVSARTSMANSIRGYLRGQSVNCRIRAAPERLPKAVRQFYGKTRATLPRFLERHLAALEALNSAIGDADRELESLVRMDPICRRLTTAPGVGAVTAALFTAIVDDASRFAKSREVGSYVGLTPGERSSSETVRRLGITKAGPSSLRWVLVQAAWCARVHYKDDPLVQWANEIARRRGGQIATIALARKLAVVLHAMWRDGSNYQPRQPKKMLNAA